MPLGLLGSKPLWKGNRRMVADLGIKSWWMGQPQGGRQGGRWLDLVGLNHGILNNGPAWIGSKGRSGGSRGLSFDAVNDYVDCGTAPSLNITGSEISASFWLWIPTGSATGMVLGNGSYNASGWYIYTGKNGVTTTHNLLFYTFQGGGVQLTHGYDDQFGCDRWNFWTVRRSGTLGQIFCNGAETTGGYAAQQSHTSPASATNNFYFSRYPNGGGDYLSMLIDDVTVADKAWTLEAHQRYYNQSRKRYPQLIARSRRKYWTSVATGITYDAASNSGYQAASSSYSWSHTCTGNNRYLSVDVSILSVAGTTITGITYNSVAMTFLGAKSSVSGSERIESWGLIAPTTGSNTIAVTLSASVASAGVAVSRTGVHQTSPTEGYNSAQATNVGAADASVSITSVADNCVIHAAVSSDDTAITANQTTRNNVTGATGSGANEDTGPVTPAGATTMSYTGVGALATWAIGGYALRPIAASTLVTSQPAAITLSFLH